ncbi:MAG: hypothetical protein KDC38_00295 [Planctomycetes bacterium]|nr:hypothetical protein [Planctomycetota bacterium]
MTRRMGVCAVVLLLGLILFPEKAEARRGIVLWGHGEDISLVESTGSAEGNLGYMYSYFSLFWVNVWTWSGKFVVYSGNEYGDLPQDPQEISTILGIEASKVKKPWTYSLPPGLLILIGIVLVGVLAKLKGRAKG